MRESDKVCMHWRVCSYRVVDVSYMHGRNARKEHLEESRRSAFVPAQQHLLPTPWKWKRDKSFMLIHLLVGEVGECMHW